MLKGLKSAVQMNRHFGWLILLLFVAQMAFGHPRLLALPIPLHTPSSPKVLTLNDAVLLALRNNPDVQNAELQRVVDKFSLEVAHNAFEPQYSFGGDATFAKGEKGSYGIGAGVRLKTSIGTEIEANFNDQVYGGDEKQPDVGLSITQPLLRGFGKDVVQADLLDAVDQERLNKLILKDTLIQTINRIISSYLAVVQDYNTLETSKMDLKRTLVTYKETQTQIKAGRTAPRDIVTQQSDIAQARITVTSTLNQLSNDVQSLLLVLGLDPQSNIKVEPTINAIRLDVPVLQKSIDTALVYNVTYLGTIIGIKAKVRAVVVARDAQRPELNAKISGTFPNGGIGRLGGSGAGNGESDYSATLDFSVPIDDLPRQQQLVNTKIELQQARIALANDRRDLISKVVNDIRELRTDVALIKQKEEALKLANKSYEFENMKYQRGITTYINLSTQRTAARDARNDLINQRITYLNNKATLDQDLGTTLRTWNIMVQY